MTGLAYGAVLLALSAHESGSAAGQGSRTAMSEGDVAWQRTVAWARTSEVNASGSNVKLIELIKLWDALPEEDHSALNSAFYGRPGPIPPTSLRITIEPIAGKLLEWYATGGNLSKNPCVDSTEIDFFSLLGMAEAVLITSKPPATRQVEAVTYLGRLLRNQGGLLAGVVGGAIFERTVQWANLHGVRPGASLEANRLRVEEVLPLLARECVCLNRIVMAEINVASEGKVVLAAGLQKQAVDGLRHRMASRIDMLARRPNDWVWLRRYANFREPNTLVLGSLLSSQHVSTG